MMATAVTARMIAKMITVRLLMACGFGSDPSSTITKGYGDIAS